MQLQTGHLHSTIPQGEKGEFKISHKVVSEEEATNLKRRSAISRSYRDYYDFRAGTYTVLENNYQIIMSDTPMEVRTNRGFILTAEGNVLIGGLGLGLILSEIAKKEKIKSVLVVEKHQEIIDMVSPHLALDDRFKIVRGDIYTFQPEAGTQFDSIYFDIWNDICSDNWEEMKKLKRKYRRYLNKENPDNSISCWREDDCKERAHDERRRIW